MGREEIRQQDINDATWKACDTFRGDFKLETELAEVRGRMRKMLKELER